jgi:hypothetical protein
MNTITINVSPEIANSFERADTRAKNRMELYINAWLNETFCKKTANESLLDIMTKSSAEAKENGYKPEMLETIIEDILEDDNR